MVVPTGIESLIPASAGIMLDSFSFSAGIEPELERTREETTPMILLPGRFPFFFPFAPSFFLDVFGFPTLSAYCAAISSKIRVLLESLTIRGRIRYEYQGIVIFGLLLAREGGTGSEGRYSKQKSNGLSSRVK